MMQEKDLRERIKRAQEGDEKIVKAVGELKRTGIKTLKDEEWEVENGIILKEGRIYRPEGDLRREIIQLHSYSNKNLAIQGKLWPRSKDRI